MEVYDNLITKYLASLNNEELEKLYEIIIRYKNWLYKVNNADMEV